MKIGVGLSRNAPDDWPSAIHFAVEAERLGVDSIWSAETWGFDGATPLAYVASHTSQVRLGTSILQIGARSPALTAMTALAMASMTGDRFVLGLGVTNPQVLEGWHGTSFDHPLTRTRELIEIVRLITARERLEYHGRIHDLPANGARTMRAAVPGRHVPIYIASVGPQMLRLTGAVAEGWIGNCFLPERAHFYLDHLRAGAESAGRTLEDLELQVPVTLEFGDDLEELITRHARATRSRSGRWVRRRATSTSRRTHARDSRRCARSNGCGWPADATRPNAQSRSRSARRRTCSAPRRRSRRACAPTGTPGSPRYGWASEAKTSMRDWATSRG
ncbi:MAG: LLM class flavin-dependent oxidoreductase [Dehalococcoidia bacterium]